MPRLFYVLLVGLFIGLTARSLHPQNKRKFYTLTAIAVLGTLVAQLIADLTGAPDDDISQALIALIGGSLGVLGYSVHRWWRTSSHGRRPAHS